MTHGAPKNLVDVKCFSVEGQRAQDIWEVVKHAEVAKQANILRRYFILMLKNDGSSIEKAKFPVLPADRAIKTIKKLYMVMK